MYVTISDKFFTPGIIHYLFSYIKGCHTVKYLEMGNHLLDKYKLELI